MVIFLVGYMGCGKSTIGRKLAGMLGARFVDMDRAIEQRAGMTVAEIFASQGEAAFRQMEREFLAGFADGAQEGGAVPDEKGASAPAGASVVATGGGAPCHGDNMEVMNRRGQTVYLKMSPPRLVDRLRHGREKRPLIKDMDDARLLEYIKENVTLRAPFYERSHLTIDCDGVGDDYIARHVANYIELTKLKP